MQLAEVPEEMETVLRQIAGIQDREAVAVDLIQQPTQTVGMAETEPQAQVNYIKAAEEAQAGQVDGLKIILCRLRLVM